MHRRPRLLATATVPVVAALLSAGNCEPGPSTLVFDGGTTTVSLIAGTAANAGPDLVVQEGSLVTLDARASRSITGELSLAWSQVGGPQVLLNAPTSYEPRFVAPVAPATLTFRLRASDGRDEAFDEVIVDVVRAPTALPGFLETAADAYGSIGQEATFTVTVVGHDDLDEGEVALSASASCGEVAPTVAGLDVTVTLTDLPCLVRVGGTGPNGRALAPVARVFWPGDVSLPDESELEVPFSAGPGDRLPVAFRLPLGPGEETVVWQAGADRGTLPSASHEPTLELSAPRSRGLLILAGERRRGLASGGIRYRRVDVSAGNGNRAPEVSAGDDRETAPGRLFSLNATAEDLDNDPLSLDVEQVLGPEAIPDGNDPLRFQAPSNPGVLLFRVRAFDGTVHSEPATVRVTVAEETANQSPVLQLPPLLYVRPDTAFVLDGSNATDPDTGVIDRWVIAQSPDDDVILLPSPVEEPTVELTAGAHGDVYHFEITVFDGDGAFTKKDIEVRVENAGPYVDPVRGDDVNGNGTDATPFASLAGAFDVAERHAFAELRLAGGEHLPFVGELPPGLSLRGGYTLSGDIYVEGDAATTLPVGDGGAVIDGGSLSDLVIDLRGAAGSLVLRGNAGLAGVVVGQSPLHADALLTLDEGALVGITDVTVEGADDESATPLVEHRLAVDIREGASARLTRVTIDAGVADETVGVRCASALLDLVDSTVRGGDATSSTTGLDATDCDIQLRAATLEGGASSGSAVGIRASGSSLFVDMSSEVRGLVEGSASDAVGIVLDGGTGTSIVAGVVEAAAPGAVATDVLGIDATASRIEARGTVRATGADVAVALALDGGELRCDSGALEAFTEAGEATGLSLSGAPDVELRSCPISSTGGDAFGIMADAAQSPSLKLESGELNVVAAGLARGIDAPGAEHSLVDVSVAVSGNDARGAVLGAGELLRSSVLATTVSGGIGLVASAGTESLIVTESQLGCAGAASCSAARIGRPTTLRATHAFASGPDSIGLEARAIVVARHVSLEADDAGILIDAASGALDVGNSLFVSAVGISRSEGAGSVGVAGGLVFTGTVAYEDASGAVVDEASGWAPLGCTGCRFASEPVTLDESGHVVAGGEQVRDHGLSAYAVSQDIDGDPIPFGAAPDVGCDELTD